MFKRVIGALVLAHAMAISAHAAPAQYSFSTTTASAFGGNSRFPATPTETADATSLAGQFAGSSITGTFGYDPTAPAVLTNADGSVIYSGNPGSSLVGLSALISGGSIGALNFSDARGYTQVGNESFGPAGSKADVFQFFADSTTPTGTNHNIVGFDVGAFTLYNVRMFWIEGQTTPETVPDLVNSSALPGAPPAMHGRLALDFIKDGATGGQQYVVFFDALGVTPVAEPETHAMLLAGLALLGLEVRRRKRKSAA
jgi:hypothetical protein